MPPNPDRYGVIEMDKNEKVISIEEKPEHPKSRISLKQDYISMTREFLNSSKSLKPSARDELEVTDLNNFYVKEENWTLISLKEWWDDAGTSFESLLTSK